MKTKDLKIVKDYEAKKEAIADAASLKIMLRIQELWPAILKVQPLITGISWGSGVWSFRGKGIGIDSQTGTSDCKVEIDYWMISVYVKDHYERNNKFYARLAVCHELYEIVLLLDYASHDNAFSIYDLDNGHWSIKEGTPGYKEAKAAGLKVL